MTMSIFGMYARCEYCRKLYYPTLDEIRDGKDIVITNWSADLDVKLRKEHLARCPAKKLLEAMPAT